jgi:hypothetical protein
VPRQHARLPRLAVVLAVLLVCAGGAAATAAVSARGPEDRRCFGAASRDPDRRCRDRVLLRTVVPTPAEALRRPNAPCRVIRTEVPFVCTFGRSETRANRRIALIGDSHATHWRPALAPVARRKRWAGFSLTRAGCPLSFALPILPERLRPDCLRWRGAVLAWLRDHPGVKTVFVSQHRVRVVVPKGARRLDVEVAGYLAAWRAVPRSVERIIVIRDTPIRTRATRRCIVAAMRRGLVAGRACATPRDAVLGPDPAVIAGPPVRRAGARRRHDAVLLRPPAVLPGDRRCARPEGRDAHDGDVRRDARALPARAHRRRAALTGPGSGCGNPGRSELRWCGD